MNTRWSKRVIQKKIEKRKKILKQNHLQSRTKKKNRFLYKEVEENAMNKVKTSIEEAINIVKTQMPMDYSYERDR